MVKQSSLMKIGAVAAAGYVTLKWHDIPADQRNMALAMTAALIFSAFFVKHWQ